MMEMRFIAQYLSNDKGSQTMKFSQLINKLYQE